MEQEGSWEVIVTTVDLSLGRARQVAKREVL